MPVTVCSLRLLPPPHLTGSWHASRCTCWHRDSEPGPGRANHTDSTVLSALLPPPPRPAGGAPLPVRVDSMFPERVAPASGLHRAPKYCTSHERGWFCSLQRLSKTSGRFAPDFQGTALSAESSASCLPTAPGSQGTPPRLTAVCGFGALGADSLTPEPFTTSLGRLGCLTGNC